MTFDETTLRLALLAVATGVLAGTLGCWLVLRGQAFLAHASGATAFAGAAVAGALALPALPLAVGAAAGVAAVTGRLAARRAELAQVATGLALSTGLAAGVIAAGAAGNQTTSTQLLGSTLLADDGDVLTALVIAAVAAFATRLLARWWLAGALHDGQPAAVRAGAGVLARHADVVLVVMAGVAAAALLPIAGALLAGTMLVVPAVTAQRIAPHPHRMMPVAAALATATMILSLLVAYETDLPPGACAAMLAAAIDVGVLFVLRARNTPPIASVVA